MKVWACGEGVGRRYASTAASADLGFGRRQRHDGTWTSSCVKVMWRIRYPDTVHLDFDGILLPLEEPSAEVATTSLKEKVPFPSKDWLGKLFSKVATKAPAA